MNIDIIGVPLWEGSNKQGVEHGSQVIWDGGLPQIIGKSCHDLGSYRQLAFSREEAETDETMYHLPVIQDCCHKLEAAVADSLSQGNFPLTIGGDHALAIGSIAGVNHQIPAEDLSVVWIDAHTDINSNLSSDSHHIHGMPVLSCLGEGDPQLVDSFGKEKAKVLPQNLTYVGARDVDEGEWPTIKSHNIQVYDMPAVRSRGMEAIAEEILANLKTPHLHLSFDVDFLDAAEFHATGLPIPNGPSIEEAKVLLSALLRSGKVCSMDFVEFSPRFDEDGSGLATCLQLLETCLNSL